jgi:hypothetical protein
MLKNIKHQPYETRKKILSFCIIAALFVIIPLWAFSFYKRMAVEPKAQANDATPDNLRTDTIRSLEELKTEINAFKNAMNEIRDIQDTEVVHASSTPVIKTLPNSS